MNLTGKDIYELAEEQLRHDPRYRERSWAEMSPQDRMDWEALADEANVKAAEDELEGVRSA